MSSSSRRRACPLRLRPSDGRPANARRRHRDLAATALPLALPGADAARLDIGDALAQLEDYILPRYRSLDAPLLAVVGGSTGAGKSTLVNGLVGHAVTRAGAIRPTTRQPILLHHPADGHWFEGQRVLPSLSRIRGTVSSEPLPANQAGPPGLRRDLLARAGRRDGGAAGDRRAGRSRRRLDFG